MQTVLRSFSFGNFDVDVPKRLLLRGGRPVRLSSKAFDLLMILVENRSRPLNKDEIIQRLWPDCHVKDTNLTQTVFLLRKALEQSKTGEQKIITIPGEGYRFCGALKTLEGTSQSTWPAGTALFEGRESVLSLAVLPLIYSESGSEDACFGVAVADGLIARLKNIEKLTVRPVKSVFHYLESPADPLNAGRELGVDFVVHGKASRTLSHFCVDVTLNSLYSGKVLWTDSFEDELLRLHEIMDSVADHVAHAMVAHVSHQEYEQYALRQRSNRAVYEACLKGCNFTLKRTKGSWKKAIEYFIQAIEIDPNHAPTYAGLARCYYVGADLFLSPWQAMKKAKAAAQKALMLDDMLAEAQAIAALVNAFHDWNWSEAEHGLKRAILLDSHSVLAHWSYANFLTVQGRLAEAIRELSICQHIEPLSPGVSTELGGLLYYRRSYEQAIPYFKEALELNASYWPARLFLGWTYELQGMHAEALANLEEAQAIEDTPRTLAAVGRAQALCENRSEALSILAQLHELSARQFVSDVDLALLYDGLGDTSMAASCLGKALQNRSVSLLWICADPRFELYRSSPFFAELGQRIGLCRQGTEKKA